MHYKISFPADYKNVAPLRDLIFHAALLQGFSEKKSERLRSVVDEICNNAIEHGSVPTSEVILQVHTDDKAIRITCQDQGHGNKLKAEEINKLIEGEGDSTSVRGRGMSMIVKSFVDELDIKDQKDGGVEVVAIVHKGEEDTKVDLE